MRLTLRIVAIAASLLFYLPFHYLWKLFGRPSPWPRRFLGGVARFAGLRVRVVGRPLGSDILFVANHVSWLDIMIVAGATGAAFVSKEDVADWPVAGWLARLNDTIFIARTQRGAAREQADSLRDALATGRPVALFPEGTTEGAPNVLPFRASLLASLFPPLPGVKLQPVAIDYGEAAERIAWVGEEGARANAVRILSHPGTTPVTLRFLDPIEPEQAGDRKALAKLSRERIVAALGASATGHDRL